MESEDKPEYGWILIPPKILSDKTIPSGAKLVFGLCYGLTRSDGLCFASNKYIAERTNLKPITVSEYISLLSKKGLIRVETSFDKEKEKSRRKIFMIYTPYKDISLHPSGYILSNNNILTKDKKEKTSELKKPLTDEFLERLAKDAEFKDMDIETEVKMFADYLRSSGKRYKDYEATFRNWLRQSKKWYRPSYGKTEQKNTFEMLMEKKNGKKFS